MTVRKRDRRKFYEAGRQDLPMTEENRSILAGKVAALMAQLDINECQLAVAAGVSLNTVLLAFNDEKYPDTPRVVFQKLMDHIQEYRV